MHICKYAQTRLARDVLGSKSYAKETLAWNLLSGGEKKMKKLLALDAHLRYLLINEGAMKLPQERKRKQ